MKAKRKRAIGDQAFLITGLGLGFTLTVQITTLTSGDFADIYAVITTISRFFALTGSYLSIIGLLLIARIPWVENALGHEDRKSTRLNSSHVSESRMPSSA